jgi:hypothetical protein
MFRFRDQMVLLLRAGSIVSAGVLIVTIAVGAAQAPIQTDTAAQDRVPAIVPVSSGSPENLKTPAATGPQTPNSDGLNRDRDDSVLARSVSIVGRALGENDRGRAGAVITLYEADGTIHTARSDKSGSFRFDDIADGQQVVLSSDNERNDALDLKLRINGETRVFWRTPTAAQRTKSGQH